MPSVIPPSKTCGSPGCYINDIPLEQMGENTYRCPNCETLYGEALKEATEIKQDAPGTPDH